MSSRAGKRRQKSAFEQRATEALIRWLIGGLGHTYRPRFVAGADVFDRIVRDRRPVIFCLWHEGILFHSPQLRRLQGRGVPMTAFTSPSRDGELVARLSLAWGAEVVRGSSSRGGMAGLRRLLRTIADGRSPVIIPDGPRGPRREAKPGAVVLARMSGAPYVAIACAARGKRLKTWDRMLLARPFTRVAVAVSEPTLVERDADTEVERRRLQDSLNALTARAEAAIEPTAAQAG